MTKESNLDEEIIELTDMVDEASVDEVENKGVEEDIIELTDIETDFQTSNGTDPVGTVTSDQLEAALEKVIEKKFSGKIESILFEVMERVIEKEIKEIRESLQKDLDQIGSD